MQVIDFIYTVFYLDNPIYTMVAGGAFIMLLTMIFSSFLYIFIPEKTMEQVLTGGILVDKNIDLGVHLFNEIFLLKVVLSSIVIGKIWIYSIIPPVRKYLLRRAKEPPRKFLVLLYFEDTYTPLTVKMLCGINVIIFYSGVFMTVVIGGGGVLLHKLEIVPLEVLNQYFL